MNSRCLKHSGRGCVKATYQQALKYVDNELTEMSKKLSKGDKDELMAFMIAGGLVSGAMIASLSFIYAKTEKQVRRDLLLLQFDKEDNAK